jgi:hypothetical protein
MEHALGEPVEVNEFGISEMQTLLGEPVTFLKKAKDRKLLKARFKRSWRWCHKSYAAYIHAKRNAAIIETIAFKLGRTATELAHDGTSTYAEPTRGGLQKIASALRPILGGNLNSHVLMDCGSGVGTALWTLCQALGIKGLGIEYSTNRVFLGSVQACALLGKRIKDLQHRVANGYGNLLDLESLPSCITVAYQFDEAFPPDLIKKLIALYVKAPLTLRFIIAAKANAPCSIRTFAKGGLYPLLPAIPCKKTVSGESSTFTIYGRRCCDYSDLEGKVFPPPDNAYENPTVTWDGKLISLPEAVSEVLDGDVEAAIRYYQGLRTDMERLMSVRRQSRAGSQSRGGI